MLRCHLMTMPGPGDDRSPLTSQPLYDVIRDVIMPPPQSYRAALFLGFCRFKKTLKRRKIYPEDILSEFELLISQVWKDRKKLFAMLLL